MGDRRALIIPETNLSLLWDVSKGLCFINDRNEPEQFPVYSKYYNILQRTKWEVKWMEMATNNKG